MKNGGLLIVCLLLLGLNLWAEGGVLVVKGAKGEAFVYNAMRGREQRKYKASESGKEQRIVVPEEQCSGLLYLIAEGKTSWIRLNPSETVEVNVAKHPWKFTGAAKEGNCYLYNWTQDFWQAHPNMLIANLQMMMNELPAEKKGWAKGTELYTAESILWVKNWKANALAALEKADLKDQDFVNKQRARIHNAWLELQFANYQMAKDEVEIPKGMMDFIRDLKFEDEEMVNYPGWESILRGYFEVAHELQLFEYTATDFLKKRAECIAAPGLRETYVLGELKNIFVINGWFYQGEEVLASVREMIVSETGKKQWQECADKLHQWQKTSNNPVGKDVAYFNFEDYNGERINPLKFKGKYLLIDVWATWCGPCKYQIPYLKKLTEELSGKDITFLSISVDKQQDKDKWKMMLVEAGMQDHGVIADDAFDHNFFERYQVKSIPRFILVDPSGKVLMDKARRPSDPVLKMQLEELLSQYEKRQVAINITDSERGNAKVSLMKPEGMMQILIMGDASNGKFDMTADINEAGFYYLGYDRKYTPQIVWLEPGARMTLRLDSTPVFTGDHADFNNVVARIGHKYRRAFDGKPDEIFDKARGNRLWKQYLSVEKEIQASSLSDQQKRILTGYWQGFLLDRMYGQIFRSKVFGKSTKCPEIRKGYSIDLLTLKLLPELVYYSSWNDYLQELLYAKMEAGKIKIRTQDSWLADLAGGIENEELRESYIMRTLYLDILRGLLQGIEARIESIRPWVKKPENQQLLDAMPQKIAKERQTYQNATPGTDLSQYSFENAEGEQVTFGDFKGKYVFIDLWSTGCNPCVGEIPYIRNMEHRFAGTPIAWVSLSLDSEKKIWLDFMKKNNMQGIQLLCMKGFKHPFIQQIGLSGIPRFVLLDKEGKVLDVNTLRPSNPVLAELLRLLLATR